MQAEEIESAIRATVVFSDLGDEHIERLRGIAEVLSFTPGQDVVVEGDPCDGLYIVVRGVAQVRHSFAGSTRTVGKLTKADFFGETALINDQARTATVVADDHLLCLRLPAEPLRELMASDDAIREQLEGTGQRRATTNLELHLGDLPEIDD